MYLINQFFVFEMKNKENVLFSPNSHSRVFLSYGLEISEELATQKGVYWVDYHPTYEINHLKNYFGIAPNLTVK